MANNNEELSEPKALHGWDENKFGAWIPFPDEVIRNIERNITARIEEFEKEDRDKYRRPEPKTFRNITNTLEARNCLPAILCNLSAEFPDNAN